MRANKHFLWAESVIYETAMVPLIALLPSQLAYGMARMRGNLRSSIDVHMRKHVKLCIEQVLGSELTSGDGDKIARDYFRLRSCESVDAMRLVGDGHSLAHLVEIRGIEHLTQALAAGRGVILAGAHFGSNVSMLSLLASLGFPVNIIGRFESKKRRIYSFSWTKPILHHLRRPPITPQGRFDSAIHASSLLRKDEIVGIAIEAAPLPSERTRAVTVDFLGGRVSILPGAVMLAELTGAPILVALIIRSPNWKNQVLEISPPVAMDGDLTVDLQNCLSRVEMAIRSHPAHWRYWKSYPLQVLGLLSRAQAALIRQSTREVIEDSSAF